MPGQKRETGKNYIGLLSEAIEEPRGTDLASIDRFIRECVAGLMAAMLRHRSKPR